MTPDRLAEWLAPARLVALTFDRDHGLIWTASAVLGEGQRGQWLSVNGDTPTEALEELATAIRKATTEPPAPEATHKPRKAKKLSAAALARKRRPDALDAEWRREIAMQEGMGHGVEAYNDAMGYGSSRRLSMALRSLCEPDDYMLDED